MSDGFTTRLRQYGFADANLAADEIDRLRAENHLLRAENCKLHVALFHVENGLTHPDEAVRKLIEAARLASKPKK